MILADPLVEPSIKNDARFCALTLMVAAIQADDGHVGDPTEMSELLECAHDHILELSELVNKAHDCILRQKDG